MNHPDEMAEAELAEWLDYLEWRNDPDSDPDEYVRVAGEWVHRDRIEIHKLRPQHRAASRVVPLQPGERYLTLAEAGALVRASSETVRYWIWQGRLQGFKPGRNVLVREAELIELVRSRETVALRGSRDASRETLN
ncbi:MAG TPA: helix-turn-helix domain-containing protein [Polyangiaceae bacterium]|nr:helix-turn-helix domain-containing protein [Polyangiaceae bacterium]